VSPRVPEVGTKDPCLCSNTTVPIAAWQQDSAAQEAAASLQPSHTHVLPRATAAHSPAPLPGIPTLHAREALGNGTQPYTHPKLCFPCAFLQTYTSSRPETEQGGLQAFAKWTLA